MRVLALHRDVVVAVSRVWQTTCVAVRSPGGEEAFVVDSPIYPDELEALPALLGQAGFEPSGLLATHADWDHLLARLAFPELSLGAAQSTADRLAAEPGSAQRELRDFDAEHYVQRSHPLTLPPPQPLPTPGRCSIGDAELELHPAPGHTSDGMAVLVPWAEVLICGDYLSPVEIPMISEGGSASEYAITLDTLSGLLARAKHVVPGHGLPLVRERAQQICNEDADYVRALREDPAAAKPPAGRRTHRQDAIHAVNQARA